MAVLPLLMILASVWMGGYRYWQTKNQMRQDLNRALQQMVLQEPEQQWLIDSLSALPPEGILTPSGRKNPFHHHLSMNPLKDTAHFSVCLAGNEESFAERAMVCSDTLMWSVDRAGAGHTTLVLKAFANPSFASIFSHSRPAMPLATFFSGLCMLALILFWCRTAPVQLKPVAVPPARLSLTPMQEKLMELFRSAPGQTLTKEEICTALWPKKENPEDTLYTFMSRLKSSLKNQSTLQIVNRRGREYVLLDDDATA